MSEPDPQYEDLRARLEAGGGVDLIEQMHARYLQLERGGTTPLGLPWPSPTDPLSEGADAIRALAEAITPSNIGAAAATHNHSASQITSGILPIVRGGTGGGTAAAARAALGAAVEGHGHALTDANITGTLPISQGGTGATTAAAARTGLGITPGNIGAAAAAHGHALTDANITGTLPISQGGTGATSAPAARTALGVTLSALGGAPVDHTHAAADISSGTLPIARGGTGGGTAAAARTALGAAATSHSHAAGDISSGTLPIARGGTGGSTAAAARSALDITPGTIGAAATSHTHSATQITSGTLPIARGGTGATSAAAARSAIDAAASSHSHPHTQITGLALTLPTTQAGGFTASVWNRNITGTRRAAWITNDAGAPTELGHTASSQRYKQDIRDLEVTDEQLLAMRAVAFRYIEQVERHGDAAEWDFGSIAEWLDEAGLSWAVFRNEDGTVEGIHYERAWLALVQPVQRLIRERDQLRARLDRIEQHLGLAGGE